MPEFESHRSYHHFKNEVLNKSRYVRSERARAFLQALTETASDRVGKLNEGHRFWRAQKGVKEGVREGPDGKAKKPKPHPEERMKPRENKAEEGRANPKGFSYLYVTDSKQTAVTEVRPWAGSWVTVAVLRTTKDLCVVYCSTENSREDYNTVYLEEPPLEERDDLVWRDIDRAFSRPVTRSDDTATYAPTQIIAERFKQEGYDGIVYRSSLAGGHNVVLFDPKAAEVQQRQVVEVNSIDVGFQAV